ncbi:MAG TPA: glutamine amidotransferase [Hyphomicrobiaceae bacterium]|nr:glutamine amidotransferase [Hyphomicrobiaceae bacterium]
MPDAISPARSQDRAIGQIPPANPKVAAKAPVCIILHQENSNPGHVGQWFVRNGYSLDIRKPRFGDPLPPTLEHHCGCVIFGGPMSANDKDAFVRTEIDWIGVPLRERKPFLGICLGAQMLTVNLGAKVGFHPEEFVEIGYYPLLASEPGGDALGQLPDHVYEWHKEGFELASGARLIATSPGAFPNQAFIYGPAAVGVQFHPEITYAQVHRWTGHNPQRLAMKGARARQQHIEGHVTHGPKVQAWLDRFLSRWICGRLIEPAAAVTIGPARAA